MEIKSRKSKPFCVTGFAVAAMVVAYSGSALAVDQKRELGLSGPESVTQQTESLPSNLQLAMQIPAPSGHKRHQPYNPIARSGSVSGEEGGGGGDGGGGGGGW